MKLKLMTWNVENLFPAGTPGGPTSDADYKAKLHTLASTITELAPDILALQEISSPESFQDLQNALAPAYPHGQLSKAPDARGIRVGFLAKRALTHPEDIVDLAPNATVAVTQEDGTPLTRMRRGALWVRTTVDGLTLNLIAVHFKSKLLTFPGGKFATNDEGVRARAATLALAERAEEAFTVRSKVTELLQAQHGRQAVVVLGDLNDVPEAASTQILLGPEGSQPDGDKKDGGGAFNQADSGDDARLFNLAKLIDAKSRYSRINNGVPELIDHILVSQELVPFTDHQKTRRALPTVQSHPDLQGGIHSVTNDPHAQKNRPASDHAPVTATFHF